MSDKVRQMTNKILMTGKIAEFELKEGTTKAGVPYISIKGAVQFGSEKEKTLTRRFEKFAQEYSVNKESGAKKENKAYATLLKWAKGVNSIASSSYEEATEVKLQCSFANNDYVDREEKLIESTRFEMAFVNDVDGDYGATADIEGYIQAIAPEVRNEAETGRLRVTVLTNDFFGNVIPVKNIIVDEDLREAFEDNYEVGQTAKLYVDFKVRKTAEKPKATGGIGVQRQTEGGSYLEMILTGADPALDEDDEKAFSKEAVKIGLAARKEALDKLVEAGYQGNSGGSSTTNRNILAGASKPKAVVNDEDILF